MTPTGRPSLREITREWFLFLTTFRRQVGAMPAEPEWVRGRLEGLMATMARAAASDPRLEARVKEARYPLVYLADEILLSCGWPGDLAWERDLLETRAFGTRHAGEDFYDRLERAMTGDDPELLEVFYKALCLGFRGRLTKQPDSLAEMRRTLFRRLRVQRAESVRFCPDAYEATDERSAVKRPADITARLAIALVAVVVAVYFVGKRSIESKFDELRAVSDDYVTERAPADGED